MQNKADKRETIMYNILSPDGIFITSEPIKNKKLALQVFKEWIMRYKTQGYYSQTCYNGYKRDIPINQIVDYCQFIKV
jgi:hypothetical protein